MKKLLFAAFLLIQAATFAQTTWKNDKMHSKLTFTVTHLMVSDVDGLFKNFDVTITSAKPDFSDAVFQLTADAASINTDVEMRDNDLKSANYFDVAKYPTLTFKSTSITPNGKNRYKLAGDLTLHGVTKPVTTTASVVVSGKTTTTTSEFSIQVADYAVTGAAIGAGKVSTDPKITVNAEFK